MPKYIEHINGVAAVSIFCLYLLMDDDLNERLIINSLATSVPSVNFNCN